MQLSSSILYLSPFKQRRPGSCLSQYPGAININLNRALTFNSTPRSSRLPPYHPGLLIASHSCPSPQQYPFRPQTTSTGTLSSSCVALAFKPRPSKGSHVQRCTYRLRTFVFLLAMAKFEQHNPILAVSHTLESDGRKIMETVLGLEMQFEANCGTGQTAVSVVSSYFSQPFSLPILESRPQLGPLC